MKTISRYLSILCIFCFLLASCEQDQYFPSAEDKLVTEEQEDDLLQAFAKILAKAQKNEKLRSLLLNEAKANYGGEQSVFYASIKDEFVNSQQSVQDLLQYEAQSLGINPSICDFNYLVEHRLQNLSFTLFDGTSANDLTNFTYSQPIPVVAEDRFFNLEQETFLPAYDEELQIVEVSNYTDPNFAVMVVENNNSFVPFSLSTKLSLNGQNLSAIIGFPLTIALENELLAQIDMDETVMIGGEKYKFINPNQAIRYINDLAVFRPESKEGGRTCDRDFRNGKEALTGIKVVHAELKAFCKWYKKDCKIEVNTVFANNPNPSSGQASIDNLSKKYIVGKRKDMKDAKKYAHTLSLYQWKFKEGDHGEKYLLDFVGKHHNPDGSSTFGLGLGFSMPFNITVGGDPNDPNNPPDTVSVDLTLPGIGYTVTKAHNDNELGGDQIEYCSSIDASPCSSLSHCGQFSSGSITFWITKQN